MLLSRQPILTVHTGNLGCREKLKQDKCSQALPDPAFTHGAHHFLSACLVITSEGEKKSFNQPGLSSLKCHPVFPVSAATQEQRQPPALQHPVLNCPLGALTPADLALCH